MNNDSHKKHPENLIHPENYPGDNVTGIPEWIINITYPVSGKEIIEKYGNQEVEGENGEIKKVKRYFCQ